MTVAPTRRGFAPVGEDGIDLVLTRAVREDLLRHKKLGNTISGWRDGQVVDVPPEEIGHDWEYIPGLPDELNPPFDQPAAPPSTNGHVHRGAGRRDAFMQGLVLGSLVTAGVAALIALLDERR